MEVNNNQDVIDSRDVIARIEELESELEDVHSNLTEDVGLTASFDDWLRGVADTGYPAWEEQARELLVLRALQSEAEGYSDWRHGATLIRDSYFEDYAREFAEDIGAISRDMAWPCNCIDWERAADELKIDYASVEFDDVVYWVR